MVTASQALDPEPTLVGEGRSGTERRPTRIRGSSEESLTMGLHLIEPTWERYFSMKIILEGQRAVILKLNSLI